MAVKKYSLKRDGNKYVSKHFKIREFACNDGSDTVLISTKIVNSLEKIRKHYKKPVYITSGYRTASYNKKVGGVYNSYHTKGRAVDFYIPSVDVKKIAKTAESLKLYGIGCYTKDKFVHIDSRKKAYKYFWYNQGYGEIKTYTFGGYDGSFIRNLKYKVPNMKGGDVKKVKSRLKKLGYKGIANNNKFGIGTKKAIITFQRKNSLKPDGIVGKKTWDKLF